MYRAEIGGTESLSHRRLDFAFYPMIYWTRRNEECFHSPFRRVHWRCHPDLNWGMELLQSSALPLGYGTAGKRPELRSYPMQGEEKRCLEKTGASDEARTRYLHLGKVALYQMSYTRRNHFPSEKDGSAGEFGASGRNRTNDTRIFSPLLYRLSYRGKSGATSARWRLGRDLNPRPPA